MAQLWTGRRTTVDLLVDVGAHKSLGFVLAAFGERAYAFAREFRDRLRAVAWLPAEAEEHRSHAELSARDSVTVPHAAVLPHWGVSLASGHSLGADVSAIRQFRGAARAASLATLVLAPGRAGARRGRLPLCHHR